jgi:hypothetical protein
MKKMGANYLIKTIKAKHPVLHIVLKKEYCILVSATCFFYEFYLMLEPSSCRIINSFERIDRYLHVFLSILSRHGPLVVGLKSHIHFSNNVIDCSKVQQKATRFKYIEKSPYLGENRLQTPNKRVFLHMSKSWATRV